VTLDALVGSCLDRNRRLLVGGPITTPPCVTAVSCSTDQFRFLQLRIEASSATIRFEPTPRESATATSRECADDGGLSAQSVDLKPSRTETTIVVPRSGGRLTVICLGQAGCSVRLL
jgi:hypothetical protein